MKYSIILIVIFSSLIHIQSSKIIEKRNFAEKVFLLVNYERQQKQLPLLEFNEELYQNLLQVGKQTLQKQQPNLKFQEKISNASLQQINVSSNQILSGDSGVIQLFNQLNQGRKDLETNYYDASLAVNVLEENGYYVYVLTFIRGKIIPDFIKQNLNKEQEMIGREVFKLLNAYRIKNGKNVLQWNPYVYQKTLEHSIYMSQQEKLSHDNFQTRVTGFNSANENVGQTTLRQNLSYEQIAQQIFEEWFKSENHRQNFISDYNTDGAVAVVLVSKSNQLVYYSTMLNVSLLSKEDFQKIQQSKTETKELKELALKVQRNINNLRSENLFEKLNWNEDVYQKAYDHSLDMQQNNRLDNNNINDIKNYDFVVQNVGYLGLNQLLDEEELQKKINETLIGKQEQKENVLQKKLTDIGIAIVQSYDGSTYLYFITMIMTGNEDQSLFQIIVYKIFKKTKNILKIQKLKINLQQYIII